MKYTFKIIIFMLALLVYVSILACGGGGSDGGSGGGDGGSGVTFSTSDLGGTWQHLIKGSTIFGSLILGPDGSVTGGTYTEIDGPGNGTYETDGWVSNIPNGNISGALTTNDGTPPPSPPDPALISGPPHEILGGQMSRDKGLIITAGTAPNAAMGLFMKPGTGYSSNDLQQDDWSYGNQNEYGTFSVDEAGVVTGTWNLVAGGSEATISGKLTIVVGTGAISGTITTGSGAYTVQSGQMSADKNVIFLAFSGNNAFVAVRMNANFGTEALGATTYMFVSFSDTPPKVAYGTITMTSDINGDTTVNGGTWIQIGPGADTGTYSGHVNIGIDGVISPGGTLKAIHDGDGTTDFTILGGQVSSNRNFSINISQEVDGASQITLLVRTP